MAKILLIDDEPAILESLAIFLRKVNHTVYQATTAKQGMEQFEQQHPDIVILDIHLPDLNGLEILRRFQQHEWPAKVIMITAYQDMETTIQAMKDGAYDYIHKPLDIEEIENAIDQAFQVLEMERQLVPTDEALPMSVPEVLIGKSKPMLEIFKKIGLVCRNQAPVLIQGETGTGKEMIARMIHFNGLQRHAPFVVMDCSASVETLIESELFGHQKGSFTGAHQSRKGKIEQAGTGTLFLDEIGELPLTVQGKFLGFLQRHEYMRVGGSQPLQSECRIVAATNRELADMVTQGDFRQDLYYLLRVVSFQVPPLRDRLSDIQLLVDHFLHKINRELGTDVTTLQEGTLNYLMHYSWPGNIRELENTLSEALAQARGQVLLVEDVKKVMSGRKELHVSGSSVSRTLTKKQIEQALHEAGWNRTEAARTLGISRPTLRKKMRQYEIIPPEGGKNK
jgi:two-component system response regulator AtoC